MSLTITDKRVVDFYSKNPNISFEEVNIFLVDVFKKSLNNNSSTFISDIKASVKELNDKIDIVNSSITKNQDDSDKKLELKFMETKEEYINELRINLNNSLSDKIFPVLNNNSSMYIDKTRLFLNDINNYISRSLNSINDKISYTNQDNFINRMELFRQETNDKLALYANKLENSINEIKELTNANQNNVSTILNKMENSSCKGKISENIIFNIIKDLYPSGTIDVVGTQKETGDIILKRNNKNIILIENKNWDRNVPQSEVQKFIRDCDKQSCSGILLSQRSGISNKENFEININNGNILLYVHNVNYDKDILKVSIDIIDNFKENLKKIDDKVDVNTIEKKILDEINKEYNNYRNQKETLQKMIKETQNNLLKEIDKLKMPNLEKYLTLYYTFPVSSFSCKFCDFTSRSKSGLSNHQKWCKSKLKC